MPYAKFFKISHDPKLYISIAHFDSLTRITYSLTHLLIRGESETRETFDAISPPHSTMAHSSSSSSRLRRRVGADLTYALRTACSQGEKVRLV